MSQQAMTWASELPYDAVGPLAFRVLLKLADVAAKDGKRAWRSIGGPDGMAAELGVSDRSIQRALRELEDAKLIARGDQRHVAATRADRRPTVYDLATGSAPVDSDQVPLHEVTPRGDTVIHRGDTEPGHEVTTAVAITSNPLTEVDQGSYVPQRASARVQRPCPTTGQRHRFSKAQGVCADCLVAPADWQYSEAAA